MPSTFRSMAVWRKSDAARLRGPDHLHELPDLAPRTLSVGVQIRLDANSREEGTDQLRKGVDVHLRLLGREVRPQQPMDLCEVVQDPLAGFARQVVELAHRIYAKAAALIDLKARRLREKPFDIGPAERLGHQQPVTAADFEIVPQAG